MSKEEREERVQMSRDKLNASGESVSTDSFHS